MAGANYMGGKRNAAKARLKDTTGRTQKKFFGKQRLGLVTRDLLAPNDNRAPTSSKVKRPIELDHAKPFITSPLSETPSQAEQTNPEKPCVPITTISPRKRTSRVLEALDYETPQSLREEMKRVRGLTDISGLRSMRWYTPGVPAPSQPPKFSQASRASPGNPTPRMARGPSLSSLHHSSHLAALSPLHNVQRKNSRGRPSSRSMGDGRFSPDPFQYHPSEECSLSERGVPARPLIHHTRLASSLYERSSSNSSIYASPSIRAAQAIKTSATNSSDDVHDPHALTELSVSDLKSNQDHILFSRGSDTSSISSFSNPFPVNNQEGLESSSFASPFHRSFEKHDGSYSPELPSVSAQRSVSLAQNALSPRRNELAHLTAAHFNTTSKDTESSRMRQSYEGDVLHSVPSHQTWLKIGQILGLERAASPECCSKSNGYELLGQIVKQNNRRGVGYRTPTRVSRESNLLKRNRSSSQSSRQENFRHQQHSVLTRPPSLFRVAHPPGLPSIPSSNLQTTASPDEDEDDISTFTDSQNGQSADDADFIVDLPEEDQLVESPQPIAPQDSPSVQYPDSWAHLVPTECTPASPVFSNIGSRNEVKLDDMDEGTPVKEALLLPEDLDPTVNMNGDFDVKASRRAATSVPLTVDPDEGSRLQSAINTNQDAESSGESEPHVDITASNVAQEFDQEIVPEDNEEMATLVLVPEIPEPTVPIPRFLPSLFSDEEGDEDE